MTQRMWNLTLNLPGEPERTRVVPQDEMASTLRAVMRGELPEAAELRAAEAPAARTAIPVAHAA